jgi:acetyl-CoA carboxylase biotin carboxylase subunit
MAEAALRAVKHVGYHSVGTIEFLVDEWQRFYFLEMNTRIQVEHPVTEMRTGIDLVREQVRIAAGEPLSFRQEDVLPKGHAIECRIYAEDPKRNFMPSPGVVAAYEPPGGPGVRVDGGIRAGSRVTAFYDPLLLKLLAWDTDRPSALERMRRALKELVLEGPKTLVPFHQALLNSRAFQEGAYHVKFVEEEFLPNAPL